MRAADLPQARGELENMDRPDAGWLLVASRTGDLELRPGDDDSASPSAIPAMPELSHSGRCSALFDGILYNRDELEQRLGS